MKNKELRHYLKCLSKPQIKDLSKNMELSQNESEILFAFYDGDMVVKTCMENYIGHTTYHRYLNIVLEKIKNYLKYTENILF